MENNFFSSLKNLFGENSSGGISSVLQKIQPEYIKPLAPFLGISEEDLLNIFSLVKRLFSGELDLQALLPAIIPAALSLFGTKKSEDSENSSTVAAFKSEYKLEPIQNMADENVIASLEDYLNSESAS